MTSKAERRRRHKAAVGRFGELAPIPKRANQGRRRMAEIEAEKDAALVALTARVHRGAKDIDDARDPLYSTDIGRCIRALCSGDEMRAVTQALNSAAAAWKEYSNRILSKSPHPQGAAIAVLPEPMQADPSLRVDLRTAEEKDAAARRAWEMWKAKLKTLPTPMHMWAVRRAICDQTIEGEMWKDRAPTDKGKAAVAALKLISRVP